MDILTGPAFHYKAPDLGHSDTTNLEPCTSATLPVVDLHGQQKPLWQNRPVDIS